MGNKLYQDKEWLYQKYWGENLSTTEIGKICEVKKQTIWRWLNIFDIIRRSISESLKGKRIGENNSFYNHHHTEKTKKKISNKNKGKIGWNKGKHLSEEHKKHLSEILKAGYLNGRVNSKSMLSKHHSKEAKQKISEALKGRIVSKETREKLRKNMKGKKKDYIVWNKGKKCPQCGFKKGVIFSKEHRKNISKSREGKYYGINSSNWKGGIEKLNHAIWNSKENNIWRLKVFKRDGFTCQICGNTNSNNFNAHHIIFLSKILQYYEITTIKDALKCELLWDTNNGVTLCKDCHKKIHSKEFRKWAYFEIRSIMYKKTGLYKDENIFNGLFTMGYVGENEVDYVLLRR